MNITLAVLIPAFYLVMRYNLHMFQLNGYKNGEHLHWLQKNRRRQALLIPEGVLSLLALFLPNLLTGLLLLIVTLALIWYYNYLRKSNTKKKLVFTSRVKRLIATDVLLNLLFLAAAAFFLGLSRLWTVMGLLIFWQDYLLLLVNTLNGPIERAVGRYYINDAKRMLAERPDLTIIGITGSYGKTSVKYYLNTLLQSRYNVLITPESYNTPMGVVKTIRGSLKSTHEIFLCEMGARHVGDIREICDIVHPRHGIITSIGPQHLETFFHMDNIVSTKYELADALPEDGLLFLNGDNEYIRQKSGEYHSPVFYGIREDSEGYHASDIRLSQLGTEFTVTTPDGETERFQTRLIGEHNVMNVTGAIAVAHRLGIPLKELKAPVRRIQPVAHRLQIIERGPVTIIDDAFNSNPVGSRAAVETLAMFDGVRILVTPGMVELGEKEEDYNYQFGVRAAACCDYMILVGQKHTDPIRKGALSAGFPDERCTTCEKLSEALTCAYGIREERHKYILLENDLPDNY